ncbi:MAG: PHP domain-containing protein [Staphylococcus sp.]|nr:PHP domain-containing protein [Staphylococcus sp.]
MVRFVCAAVEAGIKHLGFTPHSPIPIESSCNMKSERVNEYIEEFNRLKTLYGDKISLYVSMEIDYLGDTWGASHEYFQKLPLDYRLSSIHFIPTQDGDRMIDVDGSPAGFIEKMGKYFHDDIRYVVDTFYAHTLAMIGKGGFDIIGHFDKIGFNASSYRTGIEDEAWYRKHIDDVIDAIRGAGIVAEINTKAWEAPAGSSEETKRKYTPRLFPSARVIRRMRDAGIPLVVNSDVHYPERITVGRAAAFEILDS